MPGVEWLTEEDLYCVERFIKNYLKRLIETGKSMNSKEMELEVNLYNDIYNNKRVNSSIKIKFKNIEHLAFKWVAENGNPYNIEIKKAMSQRSEQCLKFWKEQINYHSETINKWLKK